MNEKLDELADGARDRLADAEHWGDGYNDAVRTLRDNIRAAFELGRAEHVAELEARIEAQATIIRTDAAVKMARRKRDTEMEARRVAERERDELRVERDELLLWQTDTRKERNALRAELTDVRKDRKEWKRATKRNQKAYNEVAVERDSLRMELAGLEQTRLRDNEYLIEQRDALRAEAEREAKRAREIAQGNVDMREALRAEVKKLRQRLEDKPAILAMSEQWKDMETDRDALRAKIDLWLVEEADWKETEEILVSECARQHAKIEREHRDAVEYLKRARKAEADHDALRARLEAMRDTLEKIRGTMEVDALRDCPHLRGKTVTLDPGAGGGPPVVMTECPWGDEHERLAWIDAALHDEAEGQRPLGLTWGKNAGSRGHDHVHVEWHAECGCAYHPEPRPHVHQCAEHAGGGS